MAGALKIHADNPTNRGAAKKAHNPFVFLVGTKTFGKGSVQEVMPISNNCAIKLTTSLYFLPNDTSIQAEGIVPDIEIERCLPPSEQQQWIAKFYGREQALANHITLTEKKEEAKKDAAKDRVKTWTERARQALLLDNQFRETIALVNLVSMARNQTNLHITTRHDAVNFINTIIVPTTKINLTEVKIERK